MSLVNPETGRPTGVTWIAVLFMSASLCAFVIAALAAGGRIPLATGAFLVGGEMETAGPLLFVIVGAVFALCAYGLWRLKNWARHLAIGLALIGVIQITQAISSGVADGRMLATVREGAQIIVRVVLIWYLLQQPVRDHFD